MSLTPEQQIQEGARHAHKTFGYAELDPRRPAMWWFQQAPEGRVLFVVFYTLACRWNRCQGCNLATLSALHPVGVHELVSQVDVLMDEPQVRASAPAVQKLIVSNNGSILDQVTFPTTALMYLMVKANLELPDLQVLCVETRVEYVEWEELELLARTLRERPRPAQLEIAVGFEAFDDRIRNGVFNKGLGKEQFEELVAMVEKYGYGLKCYFMLKPVVEMTDEAAVADIHQAIDWLDRLAERHRVPINIHLNPTYVAHGTPIETAFRQGLYQPPRLQHVARAALHARGRRLTVFLGLYDEGLAVPSGSFLREGDEPLRQRLEEFNRTQDYALLEGC